MNTKQKIINKINDAKAAKTNNTKELNEKREDLLKTISSLEDKMRASEAPDAYREAREALEGKKAELEFYDIQIEKNNTPILSEAEYKEMRGEILTERNKATTEAIKEITPKAKELTDILSAFCSEVNQLESMLKDIKKMAGVKISTTPLNPADINNSINDEFTKLFINAYFEAKRKQDVIRAISHR